MMRIQKRAFLVATLASAFLMTGCTNESVKGEEVVIIEKSNYHGKPTSVAHLDKWEDISAWIESIPNIDRVPEIEEELKLSHLTSLQREILYNRLSKISDDKNHIIQWAESRIENKNYIGVLSLLNKEQFKRTKNPQVLYLKGRALLALKRYDEADKALLTATHYNEFNGDYYSALAYVSVAKGQHSRADAALSKSVALNNNLKPKEANKIIK